MKLFPFSGTGMLSGATTGIFKGINTSKNVYQAIGIAVIIGR
jgi:hypothetical protein